MRRRNCGIRVTYDRTSPPTRPRAPLSLLITAIESSHALVVCVRAQPIRRARSRHAEYLPGEHASFARKHCVLEYQLTATRPTPSQVLAVSKPTSVADRRRLHCAICYPAAPAHKKCKSTGARLEQFRPVCTVSPAIRSPYPPPPTPTLPPPSPLRSTTAAGSCPAPVPRRVRRSHGAKSTLRAPLASRCCASSSRSRSPARSLLSR